MGKNTQVHLVLDVSLKEKLKREAADGCISIAELCRQKLRDGDKLDRILRLLEKEK